MINFRFRGGVGGFLVELGGWMMFKWGMEF